MEGFKKNRWKWTGFSERTLFDYLEAFAVPIIVGLSAALATGAISLLQFRISEDHQRSELIAQYYERMQVLLLDKKMLETDVGSQARNIGSALTLSTFRQLKDDGVRKGELLKFLYQSKLINAQCQANSAPNQVEPCSIIDLDGARLERVVFESNEKVQLPGVDLQSAKLEGANLPEIQLSKANMEKVTLTGATLTGALLNETQLKNARLERAQLSNANLYNAILAWADLRGATLTNANLIGADLRCAQLQGADLQVIKPGELEGAKFKGATYDELTKFPDGFDMYARGMKKAASAGGVLPEKCTVED